MIYINLDEYTIVHMNPWLHLSEKGKIDGTNGSQPGHRDLCHINAQVIKNLKN